jgi:hypothetical protein
VGLSYFTVRWEADRKAQPDGDPFNGHLHGTSEPMMKGINKRDVRKFGYPEIDFGTVVWVVM